LHWQKRSDGIAAAPRRAGRQDFVGGAGTEEMFDGAMTPGEIMDKLEQRVGPKGRKLFEQFLRKVNQLQAQQAIAGAGTVRSIGPSNCSPLKAR
jgi:hypothetical protein